MFLIMEVGSNTLKKQSQKMERSGPPSWDLILTAKHIMLLKVRKGLGNGQNILARRINMNFGISKPGASTVG